MRVISIAVLFIAILCIVYIIHTYTIADDKREIHEWASNKTIKVLTIEEKYFDLGPFYYKCKHERLYKVDTDKGTYWFRFGLLSPDIEKE